ncbi:alpha/beta-hydrolase [Hypoxylon trugodes]|uniref:alpha/beta-hydrolase n=1 Tax=Hypoxylon trugodes TaxID=326681 RepID=UPI00219FEBF0|nr:alpha/beta-hydrolase [Hypoxylon trugodes]KAI1390738.1 alpha/beta-hydrolase [Hypoxylon trugodes]
MADALRYTIHQYGTHELQRVGVWDLDVDDRAKYWIVYIHGGAWRDPRITHETFKAIVSHILQSHGEGVRSSIAAFASIDYRLSPHPDFPQDPAGTPPSQYRDAIHPDHLDDVRSAIAFLQSSFGFAGKYVLVGHSAGACLAYQVLAGLSSPSYRPDRRAGDDVEGRKGELKLPGAVFGFEGIYDFTGLNARVDGSYAGFLTAAFGQPEKWDAAAPLKYEGNYGDRFNGIAALGHSPDDELVDAQETEGMVERLRKDEVEVLVVEGLRGKHDEVWQNGDGVANAIMRILALLRKRSIP